MLAHTPFMGLKHVAKGLQEELCSLQIQPVYFLRFSTLRSVKKPLFGFQFFFILLPINDTCPSFTASPSAISRKITAFALIRPQALAHRSIPPCIFKLRRLATVRTGVDDSILPRADRDALLDPILVITLVLCTDTAIIKFLRN